MVIAQLKRRMEEMERTTRRREKNEEEELKEIRMKQTENVRFGQFEAYNQV